MYWQFFLLCCVKPQTNDKAIHLFTNAGLLTLSIHIQTCTVWAVFVSVLEGI